MYYKKKLNNLNTLIEITIKLNNKLYKLAIDTRYSKANNKVGFYFKYISYYNR